MRTFLIFLLCACGGFSSSAQEFTNTEPVIEAVRGKTVRVRVPAGFDRVTLQQRMVPKSVTSPRWRTLGTRYPRGKAAVLRFQLPLLIGPNQLRVLGNQNTPLPGSLLTGITTFLSPGEEPAEAKLELAVNTAGRFTASDSPAGVTVNFSASESAPRTVVESDIWRIAGDRLYFYNSLRGLQVFDVSEPSRPRLLGSLRMPGSGEEMYLLGATHAVLLKESAAGSSEPRLLSLEAVPGAAPSAAPDAFALSVARPVAASALPFFQSQKNEVIIADVRDGTPHTVANVPVDGRIIESRLVGSVLYLATHGSVAASGSTPARYGLQIRSIDLADPAHPVERDSLFLGGWGNTIAATDRYFLVAGYAPDDDWQDEAVQLIDISAPDGTLRRLGSARVTGHITSKFHLRVEGDVLTAVTAAWSQEVTKEDADGQISWTPSRSVTRLENFSLADPMAPLAIGHVEIAPDETVRATRFDGARAYVVTFRQVDPLFVIDLRNPAQPTVLGEVEAPGFSTYIEPLGDRLVTIGLVNWRPAVSLFDVSDPTAPKLLTQLQLGRDNGYAHSEAVWNEKAFKVLPEQNLILVPVSAEGENNGWFARVQLIDLRRNSLVKRGAIDHGFSPRRATVVKNAIVAISPTRLVTVDATNRDQPTVTADLEIAASIDRVFVAGSHLVQIASSADRNDGRPPTVNISRQSAADHFLKTTVLPGAPVRGATVKDGVLYIAQGEPTSATHENDGAGKTSLTVSAFDLERLPNLRLLGQTTARALTTGGELNAHWPSPGILVWSGHGYGRSWRGPVWVDPKPSPRPIVTGGSEVLAQSADGIVPSGYWSSRWFFSSPVHLAAFDFTRPEKPKFLAAVPIGVDQPWEVSAPVAAPGALYLSYRHFGKVQEYDGTNSSQRVLPIEDPNDPEVRRGQRHFLLRVDFADPRVPTLDDSQVNLPGAIEGLISDPQLLITRGVNYDPATGTGKTGSALHTSAFDGAAAHLLDVLPLTSPWQPVVLRGRTLFTLDAQPPTVWVPGPIRPVESIDALVRVGSGLISERLWWGSWRPNTRPSQLTTWAIDENGKFAKLGETSAANDSKVSVFGDLVVTQDFSRTLHLFDASNPALLESLGVYVFSGWVYPDLEHAAGGLQTGLWIPLGRFGLETVAQ